MKLVLTSGQKFKVPVEFADMLSDLVSRVNGLAQMLNAGVLETDTSRSAEDSREHQAAAPAESLDEQSRPSGHVQAQEKPAGYGVDPDSEMETSSSLPLSAYQQDTGCAWGRGELRPEQSRILMRAANTPRIVGRILSQNVIGRSNYEAM